MVKDLYSMDKETFLKLLDIEKDKIPEPSQLTSGIKRAILTGLFDDIRVELVDHILKISVTEREIIERIQVKGNFYISKADIANAFLLKETEPMRYDLIDEASARLKEYLSQRGFPDTEINIDIKKKGPKIRLIISLKEGKPLLVEKIEGPPEIIPYIRLSVDKPFDSFLLNRDINFIREFYKRDGFIRPRVIHSFDEGLLKFYIDPGPRLLVEFSGNRHLSEKELLKILSFDVVEEITDELLEEASLRIVNAYKARGYTFVRVSHKKKEDIDASLITFLFKIQEGQRFKIKNIHLSGNTIPEDKLLSITEIKKGEYYIPDRIKAGIEMMRSLYKSLGYIDIVIDEPVFEFDEVTGTVSIGINIKEGQRVLLDRYFISGNQVIDEKDLRSATRLEEGKSYNETDVNDAKLRIIELYSSRGYPSADCSVTVEIHEENARVMFTITEGEKYLFGHTIIRGNLETSQRVIKRELSYKEGEPFRRDSLIETGRRLNRLGLFSNIEVEPVKENGRQHILITLRKAPAGVIEFGVGYGEYERYRGFFDITYRNLFGMNRQISFRTEISSLEERYILNYYDPRLFDSSTSLRIIPFYEERREKNIDTGETLYRLRRYAEKSGIETPIGRNFKMELYHEFSLVKTYDIKPEVVLPREDTGTIAISSLIPGVIYDSRDNPFDPRNGILAGGRLNIASSAFGSEQEFLKITADASTYISLSKRFVFAIGLKGGAVWSYGKTEEIPVIERFFLGGRSSVRGFSQDTLGPQVTGTPVGGNYFVQKNIELRYYPGRSLSFVTFLDGGNVWLKDESILKDIRYSVGFGIRYNTPAGPIRLDYGQKIKSHPGESRGEIHFSIGHAF